MCSGCRSRHNFLAEFMGLVVSAPLRASAVHPRRSLGVGGDESHFYWVDEGAAFNLEGFRARRMTAKSQYFRQQKESASQQISWLCVISPNSINKQVDYVTMVEDLVQNTLFQLYFGQN